MNSKAENHGLFRSRGHGKGGCYDSRAGLSRDVCKKIHRTRNEVHKWPTPKKRL